MIITVEQTPPEPAPIILWCPVDCRRYYLAVCAARCLQKSACPTYQAAIDPSLLNSKEISTEH